MVCSRVKIKHSSKENDLQRLFLRIGVDMDKNYSRSLSLHFTASYSSKEDFVS